jgi:hypothetical protein
MSVATAVTATFDVDRPLDPPVPVVSSLSPAGVAPGSAAIALTVNGSGFVGTSVVRWNGAARTTTFVSATQLRAAITAGDLGTAKTVPVSVFTPAPGGGTSATVNFVVAAPSAIPPAPGHPSVTRLTNDASGVTFAITWGAVSGAASYPYVAAFTDGSGAQQGAVATPSLQLRMPYHVSGAAFGGFVCVRAANAAGQQSTDQSCSVLSVPARPVTPPPVPPAPVPAVSTLSPASVVAGSAGLTLTVNGSGFVTSSVVRWNGASRTTTFVSATQLRANIAVSDLVTAGSAAVSVFTPAPGGGTSATASFTITAPPPPVPAVPPAAPGSPTVSQVGADTTGVTFAITWGAASGASSYRYTAAFADGSAAQQGSVTGLLSVQLRMPYHASGAAFSGFVCLGSVGSTGLPSLDQSCSGLSVPARPR